MSRETPKQKLIEQIGEAFRINGNQEHAFDNLAAERLGVNATDLNCLDIIQRLGRLTAGELARQTGLSTGAVTAVVDRLEEHGYARRVRDSDDRRRVVIEGTPHFHEVAWGTWAPLEDDRDAMMRGYTNEQLELILDFMRAGTEVGLRHVERLRSELG